MPEDHLLQDVIAIRSAGGPDVLQLERRTVPVVEGDQVLIDVAASGVNRHDCNQRRRGPRPGQSDIPGLEVAGKIVAVGQGVTRWKAGDAVCALVDGGGYAQYAVARADLSLPIPAGMNALEAAALPEALFTLWHNCFNIASLVPAATVLIHGGASGVGTIAIQLLSVLGHSVVVTCGSDEKCAIARQLGAAAALNYHRADLGQAVRNAIGARGVDLILDMSGGTYSAQNLDWLAFRGCLVHLSPGEDREFRASLRGILAKEVRITGSLLRPLPDHEKIHIARALERTVWPMLGRRIRPVIARVFDLREAVQAHAMMERGEHAGKLMLVSRLV